MVIDRNDIACAVANNEVKSDPLNLGNLARRHVREFDRINDTNCAIRIGDHVRAVALAEPIDVGTQTTLQQVVTQSANQQIGTSTAIERVRTAFTKQCIVAASAIERVVSSTTKEFIVQVSAGQRVVSAQTADHIDQV